MLKNIKLGIKDLCKDKYFVFFYILFLSAGLFIVSLSMFSLGASFDYENKTERFKNLQINEYEVIPLVMDNIDSEKILDDLSEIYKEDAFGYMFFSEDQEDNFEVYLVFGDVESLYPELGSDNEITLFMSEGLERKIDSITINKTIYNNKQRLPKDFEFFFSFNQSSLNEMGKELVLVVVENPVLTDWISLHNYGAITGLLNNTKIKASSSLQQEKLMTIDAENFYVKPVLATATTESLYLTTQLYPFLCLLFGCFIILFIIAAKHKFEIKLTEYAIYVLCGATILDVSIRMVTYLGVILFSPILISLLILSRIATINEMTILAYLVLGLFITSGYLLYVYKYLKRKNLIEALTKGK